MNRYLVPLAAFVVLAVFLLIGLNKDPREVPSPLVGRAAPGFDLPELRAPERRFSPEQMHGKVWLLNVWASWCGACREEHPYLLELAGKVPVVGLDYKDERPDARQWLQRAGDPYVRNAYDGDGRVGIDYGVYGVPETYLIDAQGVIRVKHTGPMTREVWEGKMRPLIEKAGQ